MVTEAYAEAADVTIGDCFSVAKQLSKSFLNGEFDEVHVAYTNFVSVLTQTPDSMRLLPLTRQELGESSAPHCDTVYEPDSETVFASIVPE